jgi:steroid 5-alpha reductase family enzyme
MESFWQITALNFGVVLAMMVLGWVASLMARNVTVVDSLWGLGFVLIAWTTFLLSNGFNGRNTLVALLVTVWGLRLSIYLTLRNWGAGEDPRYGQWRKKSGRRFWLISLFKVFILQAVFLWAISLVLQIGQLSPEPPRFTWWDFIGALVWLVGFLFEAVGDWQLAHFKSDPSNSGKVMDRGLWAYSRHPNYFGEFLIWWGFYGMTLSTPGGWWTVICPLIVSVVLLKMTGIPLTETTTKRSRPGYSDYIERTSAFFPWFPKKEAQ